MLFNALELVVSLIGTIRNAGGDDWAIGNTEFDFTRLTDKLYIYQMEVPAGNFQYKVTFNHEKWYEKTGNKSIAVPEAQNVIFIYNAEDETIIDSVNNKNEIAILFGFEEEPATSVVEQKANGMIKFVTTTATNEADQVELVYAVREDEMEFTSVPLSYKNASFESTGIWFGDAAADILYYYNVNGSKVLDNSAEATEVGGETYSIYNKAEFEGRLVNVPGTFPGKSWDAASNEMTYLDRKSVV